MKKNKNMRLIVTYSAKPDLDVKLCHVAHGYDHGGYDAHEAPEQGHDVAQLIIVSNGCGRRKETAEGRQTCRHDDWDEVLVEVFPIAILGALHVHILAVVHLADELIRVRKMINRPIQLLVDVKVLR